MKILRGRGGGGRDLANDEHKAQKIQFITAQRAADLQYGRPWFVTNLALLLRHSRRLLPRGKTIQIRREIH
jgi:hypothetical protein